MDLDYLVFALPILLYITYRAFLYWVPNPLRYTARFHEVEFLPHDIERSKKMAEEALLGANFIITGRNKETGDIYAETRFSMSSWKEGIVISFSETPGGTRIDFDSICWVSTQMIDWGKNRRNARKFFTVLGKK